MHDPTDSDLLMRWRDLREEAAFDELARRHAGMVLATCMRATNGDRERAEEAAQAVFITLSRAAGTIRDDRSLGAWLHRCCLRAVAMQQRETRRQRRLIQESPVEIAASTAPHEDAWESLRPRLDRALAALSRPQREAVVRHYLEGRPVAAVAHELGVSESAVKMRLSGAIERLRHLLPLRGAAVGTAVVLSGLAQEMAAAETAWLPNAHAAAQAGQLADRLAADAARQTWLGYGAGAAAVLLGCAAAGWWWLSGARTDAAAIPQPAAAQPTAPMAVPRLHVLPGDPAGLPLVSRSGRTAVVLAQDRRSAAFWQDGQPGRVVSIDDGLPADAKPALVLDGGVLVFTHLQAGLICLRGDGARTAQPMPGGRTAAWAWPVIGDGEVREVVFGDDSMAVIARLDDQGRAGWSALPTPDRQRSPVRIGDALFGLGSEDLRWLAPVPGPAVPLPVDGSQVTPFGHSGSGSRIAVVLKRTLPTGSALLSLPCSTATAPPSIGDARTIVEAPARDALLVDMLLGRWICASVDSEAGALHVRSGDLHGDGAVLAWRAQLPDAMPDIPAPAERSPPAAVFPIASLGGRLVLLTQQDAAPGGRPDRGRLSLASEGRPGEAQGGILTWRSVPLSLPFSDSPRALLVSADDGWRLLVVPEPQP